MAKKRGKKKVSRSKRVSRNIKSKSSKKALTKNYDKSKGMVLKHLLVWAGLFIISWGLYSIVSGQLLSDLLFVSAIITGFVSVALVISYVVILFSSSSKK